MDISLKPGHLTRAQLISAPPATQPAGPASAPAAPAEIARLIRQLGSENFAERQQAEQALVKIGSPAVKPLEAARSDDNPERALPAAAALRAIAATTATQSAAEHAAWGKSVEGFAIRLRPAEPLLRPDGWPGFLVDFRNAAKRKIDVVFAPESIRFEVDGVWYRPTAIPLGEMPAFSMGPGEDHLNEPFWPAVHRAWRSPGGEALPAIKPGRHTFRLAFWGPPRARGEKRPVEVFSQVLEALIPGPATQPAVGGGAKHVDIDRWDVDEQGDWPSGKVVKGAGKPFGIDGDVYVFDPGEPKLSKTMKMAWGYAGVAVGGLEFMNQDGHPRVDIAFQFLQDKTTGGALFEIALLDDKSRELGSARVLELRNRDLPKEFLGSLVLGGPDPPNRSGKAELRFLQIDLSKAAISSYRLRVADAAKPLLTRLLADTDSYVRQCAVRGLGQLGKEARDSLPAMKGLLLDQDEAVRTAAKEAVERVEKALAQPATQPATKPAQDAEANASDAEVNAQLARLAWGDCELVKTPATMTGLVSYGKMVPVLLGAGTGEEQGLIRLAFVVFHKAADAITAELYGQLVSWPKGKWRIAMELMPESGKAVHQQAVVENSGLVFGGMIFIHTGHLDSRFPVAKDFSARRFKVTLEPANPTDRVTGSFTPPDYEALERKWGWRMSPGAGTIAVELPAMPGKAFVVEIFWRQVSKEQDLDLGFLLARGQTLYWKSEDQNFCVAAGSGSHNADAREFTEPNLPKGIYRFSADTHPKSPGSVFLAGSTVPVDLTAKDDTAKAKLQWHDGASLTVRAVDPQTGKPSILVPMVVRLPNGLPIATELDATGQRRLDFLPEGKLTIELGVRDWWSVVHPEAIKTVTTDVHAGGNGTLTIQYAAERPIYKYAANAAPVKAGE
jgi:HEAT repeat protein